MVSRITNQMMLNSSQRNVQSSMASLARLQDQASSLKAISRPSDDPTATATSMLVRGQQRATEQYARNISDGLGWLSAADSTLSTSTGILQRARDLVVQGASDAILSPAARESIASELESIRGELEVEANTTYLGRAIFAGSADGGTAFDSAHNFLGAAGATVERRVGATATVQVDVDGAAAFGTGPTSVFAVLSAIASDLRAGTNIGHYVTDVDDAIGAVLGQRAIVGARYSQVENAQQANADDAGTLEARRAGVEDADLAEVILQLQLQQTSYQVALSVTAKALQPSLMSFIS